MSANGYVRSEGCGIVILRRLRESVIENSAIQAVIKSTVVNQDGKSGVLTAPSPKSQR